MFERNVSKVSSVGYNIYYFRILGGQVVKCNPTVTS